MKNHLKYLISLFLALVVLAGDGTLNSQSKSQNKFWQIPKAASLDKKKTHFNHNSLYVRNSKRNAQKIPELKAIKTIQNNIRKTELK